MALHQYLCAKDSMKEVALKLWVCNEIIYWNQASEKSLGGKILAKCFSTRSQLLDGECGQMGALVLCVIMAIDWKCREKGTKRQSAMGTMLLLCCCFFLHSCKLSANITFINFWTEILQSKYAPSKLGRLFRLTYEGKLSIATALHCINVSDSGDMLPLIGCWSVTTVWNNDIYFKEIKKHWRRWTDIDSFSFRYVLIDDRRWCFLSSCM